jgi:PAS domain S-box-containing protein
MKIQNRLILLLTTILGFTLIVFWTYLYFAKKTTADFFQSEIKDSQESLDKILDLKSQSLRAFIVDYTFWDDTVAFAKTFDPVWAKQNIEASFDTYNLDAVWVFDINQKLGYAFSPNSALKNIVFPQKVFATLLQQRLTHFFLDTPAGLLEVVGATIHPTTDKERKTPPQGFFCAAKIWNTPYLEDLCHLMNATLTLLKPNEITDIATKSDLKNGVIVFNKDLLGADGQPAAVLHGVATSRVLQIQNQWSRNLLFLFLFFAVLILLLFAFSLARWVGRPLTRINKALETEKTDSLLPLKNDSSEWGDISRLIMRFFLQKNELLMQIRERQKAQEASKKLTLALEKTDDAVYITDKKGTFEYVNPAFERLTGYKKEETLGKTPRILRSGKQDAAFYEAMYTTILSGRTFQGTLTNKRKDGQLFDADVTITPIINAEGALTHFVSIDRDVTKQRELEKSQRLTQLGKLVSDMSHEVNNPLQIIYGQAEIALMENVANAEVNESLRIIIDQCQRAKDIIMRVLQFSRPSKNEIRDIDITSSLQAILHILETQLRMDNITLIKKYGPGLSPVTIDEKQIQEVFMNLLNNARDAIGRDGSITISIDQQVQFLEIRIKDSGPGMNPDTLSHLSEPFFTTKEKGTGLGIHICYNIIRAHGGELRFESENQKGTTAIILLPTTASRPS